MMAACSNVRTNGGVQKFIGEMVYLSIVERGQFGDGSQHRDAKITFVGQQRRHDLWLHRLRRLQRDVGHRESSLR
jgi:hypothetical protein